MAQPTKGVNATKPRHHNHLAVTARVFRVVTTGSVCLGVMLKVKSNTSHHARNTNTVWV